MTAAIFYILASVALLSAVMVIWSRNVVHSAIYLVLTFLCVAGVYVLLRAEFVAVAYQYLDRGPKKPEGAAPAAGLKPIAQSSGGGG